MTRILFTSSAERDYKKLPSEVQERIEAVFDRGFSENPFAPEFHTKKLKPPFPGYRIRFGDYRVLFEVEPELIRIYKIKNRKDSYR